MSDMHAFKKRHDFIDHPRPQDVVFAFHGQRIFLLDGKQLPTFEAVSGYFNPDQSFYCFGESDDTCYVLVNAETISDDATFQKILLKSAWGILSETHFALAKQARHLYHWRITHRYCGACGSENSDKGDEQAFICLNCQRVTYPRISPCVIVLITDSDKMLLARSPHFPPDIYGNIAGFVEPGESLEEAIHREVAEEVGIKVTNIKYFNSQPWPFPDSLMIGFTADYLSGDITIDEIEIEDAQWFDRNHLPILSSGVSISRQLIDAHLRTLEMHETT